MRVISGKYRSRPLRSVRGTDTRPTSDRLRETLFNILGPDIEDSLFIDVYAGTGALGLEALSRGAAHVTFIEQDPAAVRELRARLEEWGAADARVEQRDAFTFLAGPAAAFDIAFLDPPFDAQLLAPAARVLEQRGWLKPGALIYVECAARATLPPLPPDWKPLKAKRAGEVGYHLLVRAAPDPQA